MDYLKSVLKSLLREEARQVDVIDAIKKRYEVEINYSDGSGEQKGTGYRLIQPVAYGKTKSGNLVIRAYQPFGDTKTKAPHWKMFRLDRIEKWNPLKNRKFSEPPAEQWNDPAKFNSKGDNTMAEVYLVANFNGKKNDNINNYNKKRNAEKVATDPYYNMKRNMKKSVNVNNVDYIKKNLDAWQNSEAAKRFRGNGGSVYDMSKTANFGGNQEAQTVGPVRKNNAETIEPGKTQNNSTYINASNNGPMYKDKGTEMNQPPTEGEIDDEENDLNYDEQRRKI